MKNWQARSTAAKLTVAGLVVAAAGIMIQFVSGEDFPPIPPGPIILLAAAAVAAFASWRRADWVGLGAAAFISIGGVIATIAGSGFSETIGDPDGIGGFVGALIQVAGLVIALPAGIAAVRESRWTTAS
jgi:uncharacterized membrane protein YhhN